MRVSRRLIRYSYFIAALGLLVTAALCGRAQAGVSVQDGFAPDGSPQWHFELVPYAWIPATSSTITLGRGASVNVSQGMPSVSQVTSRLTGAFMGNALARYGAWSGELDFQWVSATAGKSLPPDILGTSRSLNVDGSLVRVAPGFGYQVYKRSVGRIPTTVDARVGFAWFQASESLSVDRTGPLGRQRVTTVSDSSSFAQPWVGARAAIYPWPRWRFEAGALLQGFGVDGGSWGWGASATATWAANDWLNLMGGYRALKTDRIAGSSRVIQSIKLTEYGPMIGAGFTF